MSCVFLRIRSCSFPEFLLEVVLKALKLVLSSIHVSFFSDKTEATATGEEDTTEEAAASKDAEKDVAEVQEKEEAEEESVVEPEVEPEAAPPKPQKATRGGKKVFFLLFFTMNNNILKFSFRFPGRARRARGKKA